MHVVGRHLANNYLVDIYFAADVGAVDILMTGIFLQTFGQMIYI